MTVDPSALQMMAGLAVQTVVPFLTNKAAEGAALEAGKTVLTWLKEKLTRASAQEAIADVETAPESGANQRALAAVIEKALEGDGGLREELAGLLEKVDAKKYAPQIANTTGDGNTVVQVQGKNIETNIG